MSAVDGEQNIKDFTTKLNLLRKAYNEARDANPQSREKWERVVGLMGMRTQNTYGDGKNYWSVVVPPGCQDHDMEIATIITDALNHINGTNYDEKYLTHPIATTTAFTLNKLGLRPSE